MNAISAVKMRRNLEFETPYTCLAALKEGSIETRVSAVVMGFGNIVHKQAVKGVLFLAAEIAYIAFMILYGFHNIYMLGSLGTVERQEIWNEELQVFEYTAGDQSILLLLYGLATIILTGVMFWIWRGTLKSAYKAECLDKAGKHVNTFAEDLKSLLDDNLYRLLMTPPMIFIGALTILPLIFMICMAFTNYSKIDNHLVLFDWVGLDNFAALFDANSILGSTFWSVLVWTLVWAFFATFTNYIAGMILAIVINRKETKAKGFWRFCFVLPCAVPMFVSLLIMRTMLQPDGAVNVLLRELGVIAEGASLPFFTDPTWARVTVIVINIWVGVPYTLLQLTGVLQNIPTELLRGRQGGRRQRLPDLLPHHAALHAVRDHPLPDRHLHRQRQQLQRHLPAVRRRPGHRPGLHRRQHRPAGHLAVQADHRQAVLQCGRRRRHPHVHHPGHRLAAHLPQQQVLP